MGIKRNATAVLELTVEKIPYTNIKSIELCFKNEKDPKADVLLEKKYDKEQIELKDNSVSEGKFVMIVSLKPDETFKLKAGSLYMDSRVVLNDGTVPDTPIRRLDDVKETLFGEVFKNES